MMCEGEPKTLTTSSGEQLTNTPCRIQAELVANKQLAGYLLKNRWQIVLGAITIFAAVGCGNTNMGAMDGGDSAVRGDVVEYGVRGRPQNNPYCAQLAAPTATVQTSSVLIRLCSPDANAQTVCPGSLPNCVAVNEFSTDLDAYVRDNRVPKVCTNESRQVVESCNSPPPQGCGDGTFCVHVHYRFADPSDRDICVPYPCNP